MPAMTFSSRLLIVRRPINASVLTKGSDAFRSSDEEVDQPADEMEAQDNNHPDQLLDGIKAPVRDCVDEHPNPKHAGGKGESPNEYQ
jgi:hypothetical protein